MGCDEQILNRALAGVRGLTPYQPGKPIDELERELGIRGSIKLASNENPLGCSPAARLAAEATLGELARYPDGGGFRLKRALSEKLGVDPASITLGNGSNDVLDLIARVFIGPGRNAVFSEHAFAVYPISTLASGGACKAVPAVDYGHDLTAMAAAVDADTGVVFIANPNNPTGTWLPAAGLRGLLDRVPAQTLVVVDEAYFEYVHEADYPDASRWLTDYPNLIVTRTFSKAYGLAALRVGYALSAPEVADLLNRVRQPFNVNAVALAAAEAALGDGDFVARSVELNDAGLRQLGDGCAALGLETIPSVGNFVTVQVGDVARVNDALLHQGVIVRPVENYGLSGFLRVSVGTAEDNARFLNTLESVL